jgi:asparagine synthase (glutamine-hydrolysing)
MYFDYSTYLRALLAKIDRATMLSSLESRAPFLDPLVRRFAFALPDHLKTDGLRTKPLLKHVASRYLPRRIVHRRKRGLSVPVNQLMRTELRAEFDRLVCDERFEPLGLLPPGLVGELVSQHRDRHANHGRALWTLLVLGMWTEHWMGA